MKSHVVQQALPVVTAIRIPLRSLISIFKEVSLELRILGAENAGMEPAPSLTEELFAKNIGNLAFDRCTEILMHFI
jgi:hypothetical protein